MKLRIPISAVLAGCIIMGLAGIAPVLADNQLAIEYYNNGVELAYQGDYNQALEKIDLALAENPNFTLALTTKAGILNSLGRYQEALSASDEAIVQNQSLPYAWVNKATALIKSWTTGGGAEREQPGARHRPHHTRGHGWTRGLHSLTWADTRSLSRPRDRPCSWTPTPEKRWPITRLPR